MAACVIPFPAGRQARQEVDRFAVFQARLKEIFASDAAEPVRIGPPPAPRREEEICRTLRRIERRLRKMERLATLGAQRDLPATRECL